MDIDYLKKQIDACIEECERLNTDGPAYAELCEYIDKERGVSRLEKLLYLKNEAYGLSETLSEQRRQERDNALAASARIATELRTRNAALEAALGEACDGWESFAESVHRDNEFMLWPARATTAIAALRRVREGK